MVELCAKEVIDQPDLAFDHAGRRVIDAGTVACFGVIAAEEVFVEPQPGFTT